MEARTPLSKALGLGSAKSGTAHWWLQRVTAVALLPLSWPLLHFIQLCFTSAYSGTVAWLAQPFNATCIIAWLLAVFYHAAAGLQVVIEDYVTHEGAKIIAVWAVNLVFVFLAVAAVLAVLRITLAG